MNILDTTLLDNQIRQKMELINDIYQIYSLDCLYFDIDDIPSATSLQIIEQLFTIGEQLRNEGLIESYGIHTNRFSYKSTHHQFLNLKEIYHLAKKISHKKVNGFSSIKFPFTLVNNSIAWRKSIDNQYTSLQYAKLKKLITITDDIQYDLNNLEDFIQFKTSSLLEEPQQLTKKIQENFQQILYLESIYDTMITNISKKIDISNTIPLELKYPLAKIWAGNAPILMNDLKKWDYFYHYLFIPKLKTMMTPYEHDISIPQIHQWAATYYQNINTLFKDYKLSLQHHNQHQINQIDQYLQSKLNNKDLKTFEMRYLYLLKHIQEIDTFIVQDVRLHQQNIHQIDTKLSQKEQCLDILKQCQMKFGLIK